MQPLGAALLWSFFSSAAALPYAYGRVFNAVSKTKADDALVVHGNGKVYLPNSQQTSQYPLIPIAKTVFDMALEQKIQQAREKTLDSHSAYPDGTPSIVREDNRLAKYQSEAWSILVSARKGGPHLHVQALYNHGNLTSHVKDSMRSATKVDWYIMACTLMLLVVMDCHILSQMPETLRTHVVLLVFWVLAALAFCVDIMYRLGPEAGIDWAVGYSLELIFSVDTVFVTYVMLSTFETPRRLITKVLFIGLLSGIIFRFVFYLGLAHFFDRLQVLPYLIGIWLLYIGSRQIVISNDDCIDVTQTLFVRFSKACLGDRLVEFYDEEEEAIISSNSRGKVVMTLLGVVLASVLVVNFFFSLDVALTKMDRMPNVYINFSSSAIAAFAARALVMVARDILDRFHSMKYAVGLALLVMGSELILSDILYVNACVSAAVLILIVFLTFGISWLQDPAVKHELN